MGGAELCTVAKWLELAKQVIGSVQEEKNYTLSAVRYPLIFTGGTGLYFNALFHGISHIPDTPPDIREKVRAMDISEVSAALGDEADGNPQRMRRALEVKLHTGQSIKSLHVPDEKHPYSRDEFKVFYVNVSRETIYEKINQRFHDQIKNGALDEVRELLKLNLDPALPIMKAHGVPEFARHFVGEITLDEAISKAQQNVRNYAKRQMTWFKNQLEGKIEISPEISDFELERIAYSV